ncbi:hypothetical protein CEXT_812591 [Caerostris extrusa]|uniref:Uncharacterized protein n=1 Tax=Caerostris extrusa TaxID=172846 RepID=A0AAV4N1R7_CAEEX|nr:hypothetical protein CEXT_812591 [Caerostris extrusa]
MRVTLRDINSLRSSPNGLTSHRPISVPGSGQLTSLFWAKWIPLTLVNVPEKENTHPMCLAKMIHHKLSEKL